MLYASITLSEIQPPERAVRVSIDEDGIRDLADSIRKVGVLNPLIVRRVDIGYEVVAGHRRYLAAIEAGLLSVPCLVREPGDGEMDAAKLHENLYRQELSPVEEGAWFAELYGEMGEDVERVAAAVGQSRHYVEGRLALLAGDRSVLEALAAQEITLGAAFELNKIQDPRWRTYYIFYVKRDGASVALVKFWRLAANMTPYPEIIEGEPIKPLPVNPLLGNPTFPCYLCGNPEPESDIEVLYVHRGCRTYVERAQARQAQAAGASGG